MLASSPSFHVESDINSLGNPPDSAKRHPALAGGSTDLTSCWLASALLLADIDPR